MSATLAILCLIVLAQGVKGDELLSAVPQGFPEDFDCPMRQLALEFAMEIQPFLSKDKLQEIADALNGAQESANKSCVAVPTDWNLQHTLPPEWQDLYIIDDTPSIYVDFNKGNDQNNGSITSPLKHLDVAIEVAQNKYGSDVYKRIILREGRHYLRTTIQITPKDNNLLITNYNSELVELSAAIPLNCEWSQSPLNTNIYECKITENIDDILGLRVNGTRAIRARYPNANPEIDGFGSNLMAKAWVPPSCKIGPDMEYWPKQPLRNDSSNNWFQQYQLGVGGCCDVFTPNAGYWCGNHTQGGGAFPYRYPTGLVYNSYILPNAPYANIDGAVIQAWRPGIYYIVLYMYIDDSK